MMGSLVLTALGLFFVFEGILPFLSPRFWRHGLQRIFIQSDKVIRVVGLICMLAGLTLVCVARDFY